MDTNTKVDYKSENGGYWKVLIGLLILTTITFIQPGMFLTDYTFATQIFIGAVKAWMILMYYMHLKGEKLIIGFVLFSMFLVIFFFVMIAVDVSNFQYSDMSHITSQTSGASHAASPAHH